MLEGLKSGLVDATETLPRCRGFGGPCIRSCLRILAFQFCSRLFDDFHGSEDCDQLPERLQELILRIRIREHGRSISNCDYCPRSTLWVLVLQPVSPRSAYQRKIRQIKLSPEQHAAFKERGSVEKTFAVVRKSEKATDDIARIDVYGALSEYAKMHQVQSMAEKWWT